MKEGTQVKVRYHKEVSESDGDTINIKHETTERVIIPTRIPKTSPPIKALDVSHLSAEERGQLENAWEEYKEYIKTQMNSLFTFEDFVDHTDAANSDNIKWRSFKSSLLEVIDYPSK